ncbi:N-acetylglucosamine-6-phosphate deacetylase [Paenibacillus oenotherae]|uniref:N-acetylglucosamine-6-phosphate deacetylase n=2 Tax=Paenibacillus oenotherae TaxID=1435645 RepID=A0ABS7DAQ5_9BACL|nr:N-acetylglucosamine-6-phosphate deacetylase [Paenibacillus oenotherae]
MEKCWIRNVHIVAEDAIIEGSLMIEDGLIVSITQGEDSSSLPAKEADNVTIVDGKGGWLLPGFIDLHVHGGYGADFMDAAHEAYDTITSFHASKGTTTMLATTVTASPEAIEAVIDATASYIEASMPYASLAGVHVEGPFISERWPGAQNPAYITAPRLDWLQRWNREKPGIVKLLTLAPEKEGALPLVSWLAEHGIIAACGHTDALYEEIEAAVDAGLSHAVHTFNAMRGLHHREPGTAGAVLTDDRIYAELIADGHHVHPAAIRLLAASKPGDKLILITDAMSAAGLGDGQYDLGGLTVDVQSGVARLSEGGSLAGSTLTMLDAVRNMMAYTGLNLMQVSRMASANPAARLGLQQLTGSIASGKQADLVLTDQSLLSVQGTWVRGRRVYSG